MTAPHIVDPAGLLSQALADASPDLMRELLQTMINALLSADDDAVCGAEWGQRSDGRTNHLGRLPASAPRYACRHDRRRHAETALRHLLPFSGCSNAASAPSPR